MKTLRTILGIYSFILISFTTFTNFKDGLNFYSILLLPLPLYFIIATARYVRSLCRQPDHDFAIGGYTHIPTVLDLRFLTTQTSPTFLITICLFSFAISGTIVRALTR